MKETLKKYKLDTKEFELAKRNYYRDSSTLNNPEYNIEAAKKSFVIFCDQLKIIIKIAARECDMKESADIYQTSFEDIIPKIGFNTNESNMSITFGLFRDFYIITRIENPNNISSMKDEFWLLLAQLQDMGDFSFKEQHKPTTEQRKKYPHLFKQRGNIYKLTRNYFLNQIEYGHCSTLGFLTVKWDSEAKFTDLIPKFIESFKIMYRLNFLLWIEHQKKEKLRNN